MALTQDEKTNVYLVMCSIWGTQVADTITINDDVVEVVAQAVTAMETKSDIIKRFLINIATSVGAHLTKVQMLRRKGDKIADFIIANIWQKPLNAARVATAAQYRTELMMASYGLW